MNTWHNTGGNGPASAVWVRAIGKTSVEIKVMAYRCLATVYDGGVVDADYEGIPFATLRQAKTWGDQRLVNSMRRAGSVA